MSVVVGLAVVVVVPMVEAIVSERLIIGIFTSTRPEMSVSDSRSRGLFVKMIDSGVAVLRI